MSYPAWPYLIIWNFLEKLVDVRKARGLVLQKPTVAVQNSLKEKKVDQNFS
jgi:hypothetical protein